ncbi:MAG TPA: hypothetical protein GXX18_02085, partial [Bacillales bacterium]|nr:hypothetical protein [Bacillales bacterium]
MDGEKSEQGEDAYKGDITNPLSLNLYTYVYNNPLKHIDPSGNDAIIVTAREAAYGFGHTSALFQDKYNDWYYTYWEDKGVIVKEVNVNSLKELNN